jgi:hypothetical protein
MHYKITVRVDRKTRQRLSALAKRRRVRESVLVRQALESLLAAEERSPYEMWRPSIGIASSGRRDLSVDTGRRFAELLKRRSGR